MAQPTRSDGQAVRRRLSHNNLRRKQWRRRLPKAERKRPRRSGNSAALNLRGARRAPHFFIPTSYTSCCPLPRPAERGPRGEVADAGPTCQAAECAGRSLTPQSTSEGRNPQWRRRLRAERRRRRRRGKFAAPPKRGRVCVPFFMYAGVRLQADLPQCRAVPDLHATHHVPRLRLIEDLDAIHHVTEDRVARIEMRLR
jgi:hypothetical protein